MKKYFFVIVFLFAVAGNSFSQTQADLTNAKNNFVKKLNFDTQIGLQAGFGRMNSSSVFVAPRVSFPVTKRLSVGGGIIFNHSFSIPFQGTFFNDIIKSEKQ